jgi:hypothetical protein
MYTNLPNSYALNYGNKDFCTIYSGDIKVSLLDWGASIDLLALTFKVGPWKY